VQLDPVEQTMLPVHLLPPEGPPDAPVDLALRSRPEIAENRSLVQAAVSRVRQSRVSPFVPTVQAGYQAGNFTGGYTGDPAGFFGTSGGREDFSAALVWELKNLGLGDIARTRRREIDADAARIRLAQTVDRIVTEVVSAQAEVASRERQIDIARNSVETAIESLQLNENRIRGGNGLPIELLQSIQALDRARLNYLQAITSFNKAQFRLYVAVGTSPLAASEAPELHRRDVPVQNPAAGP
jgi:outer membrane protein TolC